MKRYRLHDLLRAAAVTWLAACGSDPSTPATSADSVSADAPDSAMEDANQTTDVATGTDATAATDAAGLTDSVAGTDAVAATDAAAGTDGSTATDVAVGTDIAAEIVEKDIGVGPKLPYPCLDPVPLVVQGQDTGVDTCANGMIRRREVKSCPVYQKNPNFLCPNADPGWEGSCKSDLDCPSGPCKAGGFIPGCACTTGCQNDAECGTGSICLCGPEVGVCTPADCTSDKDCEVGVCGDYESNPGCGFTAMACQTEGDECAVDADCKGDICTWDPTTGRRFCSPPICAIGRPFAVDGAWRTAGDTERADWQLDGAVASETTGHSVLGGSCAEVPLAHLSAAEREALADWWLQAGQMEHASVASFARLSLELMAVAAPADLLARSQQAGLDEVHHAQTCFALAGHYGHRAVGPGALAIGGALRQPTLAHIAAAAATEGCAWESAAALEARIAAVQATDPALQALLLPIAEDEARHAELAWDIVRWALQAGATADERNAVRVAVTAALDEASAGLLAAGNAETSATPANLPVNHGVLTPAQQRSVRQHAVSQVIAPARARLGL
jgi:hypothetical protein